MYCGGKPELTLYYDVSGKLHPWAIASFVNEVAVTVQLECKVYIYRLNTMFN